MKIVAVFSLCTTLLVFSSHAPATENDVRGDSPQDWMVLEHTFQEAFNDGQLGPYSAKIAPGAQLAIGDSLLDLQAAFAVGRANPLAGRPARPPMIIRRKMNAEKDAAFVLLRMESDSKMRYHTVVFMKDSTGAWMVESWHVSR